MEAARTQSFRSRRHPGQRSRSIVFAQRLVEPLAFTLLPIMVSVLIMMLQSADVLVFSAWTVPIAFSLALIWNSWRLGSEVIEVHISASAVAVRTGLSGSGSRLDLQWFRLADVRKGDAFCELTLEHSTYRLHAEHWEDFGSLTTALLTALRAHDIS